MELSTDITKDTKEGRVYPVMFLLGSRKTKSKKEISQLLFLLLKQHGMVEPLLVFSYRGSFTLTTNFEKHMPLQQVKLW